MKRRLAEQGKAINSWLLKKRVFAREMDAKKSTAPSFPQLEMEILTFVYPEYEFIVKQK